MKVTPHRHKNYVYVVIERIDAYPEDGGGENLYDIFAKEEDAIKCKTEMGIRYSRGEYGDAYYSVHKMEVK